MSVAIEKIATGSQRARYFSDHLKPAGFRAVRQPSAGRIAEIAGIATFPDAETRMRSYPIGGP